MSDEEKDPARAAIATVPAPPPVFKVAADLASARGQEFVHVDGQGQVRTPARLRALEYGSYGLMVALAAGSAVVYYQILGVGGAGVGLVLGGWYAYLVSRSKQIRRGLRLLVADRFEEAVAAFARVARAPLLPRKMRATAEQNLAACHALCGRHDEALTFRQAAVARWRGSRKVLAVMARQGEVYDLIHLGRLEEARARFNVLGAPPGGDYLRLLHWTLELYLAMVEGQHALGDDELHRRAREALAITTSSGLLGLLAWAYQQRGDQEMCRHLLVECLDRHLGPRQSAGLPLLQRWLDQRADRDSGPVG